MTILMIYLAGCLMVLAIWCVRLYKKGRVEVYDVLECALFAICSWVTLLAFVMVMIGNNINKVLWERKEDKQK